MKKTFRDGWIFTYPNGVQFNLMEPQKEMIWLDDVCHSLATMNRYAGHTKRPYSVAEHLCRCCDRATENFNEEVQLEVLLHDFPEYVYQDIMSPTKMLLGADYKKKEDKLQKLINEIVLGYPDFKYPEVVHIIDIRMLYTECRDLTLHENWWEEHLTYEERIPLQEYSWQLWRDRLKRYIKNRLGTIASAKLPWSRTEWLRSQNSQD